MSERCSNFADASKERSKLGKGISVQGVGRERKEVRGYAEKANVVRFVPFDELDEILSVLLAQVLGEFYPLGFERV